MFLIEINLNIFRFSLNCVNSSVYNETYVKPVYRPKDREELRENELRLEYEHVPVRAAGRDATCSVFDDPLYR